MDPKVLRMMTDPKALRDPEAMRALAVELRASTRQSALKSLRTNSSVSRVLGALLLVAALGIALAVPFGAVPTEALFVSALCAVLGGVFAFVARLTAPPSARLLQRGLPGRATVREVKGFGRTMGIEKPGLSATLSRVTVALQVERAGLPPFDLDHSELMLSSDLQYLQAGASIPVRLDSSGRRLAIDWSALG